MDIGYVEGSLINSANVAPYRAKYILEKVVRFIVECEKYKGRVPAPLYDKYREAELKARNLKRLNPSMEKFYKDFSSCETDSGRMRIFNREAGTIMAYYGAVDAFNKSADELNKEYKKYIYRMEG